MATSTPSLRAAVHGVETTGMVKTGRMQQQKRRGATTTKTMGQDDTNTDNKGTDKNDNNDDRNQGTKTDDKEDNYHRSMTGMGMGMRTDNDMT